MKIKTLLKSMVILVVFLGVVGVMYQNKPEDTTSKTAFGWKYPEAKFPSTGSNQNLIAYSDIRDPGGVPQGLPVRLKIPSIGVDSAIEDALITTDGRMDVPVGSVNVAWFSLGPHPGQIGSAVIGGHFGINNGVPFVFYDLDKLRSGDKIYIEDDKGDTLAFIVRKISLFDRNADATTVFTSNDGLAHLNLITCEGVWNRVNDSYPERRVVFTDAIPTEGAVVVKPKLPLTAIVTPTLIPTMTQAPVVSSSINNSPSLTQTLIASAQSLYATPMDGIITFLLIISIVFIIFKIIRR
jgi:LPXTG-site transpeptidase (sortase) family protein